MKKRALAALLALILCLSCFTPTGNAAAAVKQQDVEVQLINLMKQYCGTYWAQNYYGARQCKGFADMISDKLFGLTGGPGPYSDSRYYLPNAESRGYQKIGILAPGSCTAENLAPAPPRTCAPCSSRRGPAIMCSACAIPAPSIR